jgi:hypothetical protein
VTPGERAQLERQALAAGLSAAEFIRRAVLGRQIAPRRPRLEHAALVELVRVGNNLNQMAHATHCGHPPAVSVLKAALVELHTVLNQLSQPSEPSADTNKE